MRIVLIILTGMIITFSTSINEVEARLIKKGSVSIGGLSNLGISNVNRGNGNDSTSFMFSGSVGYFVFDKVELGTSFGIGYSKYRNSSTDNLQYYSISPFVSYHIPINDPSNFYIGCGAGYAKNKINYDDDDFEDYDDDGKMISAFIGWEYYINQSLALRLGLNYSHIEWDYAGEYSNNEDSTNSISTNAGFNILF